MLLLAPYCSANNVKAFLPLFFDVDILLKKNKLYRPANDYTTNKLFKEQFSLQKAIMKRIIYAKRVPFIKWGLLHIYQPKKIVVRA